MATCKACQRTIKFIRTTRGKMMPVEVKPITVVTATGAVISAFVPHWGACPGAEALRRKRTRPRCVGVGPRRSHD